MAIFISIFLLEYEYAEIVLRKFSVTKKMLRKTHCYLQTGTLEVVVPPDILNDNETSIGGVAVEGGTVNLRCHATGAPKPEVRWKREDSRNIVLRHEGGREKHGKGTSYMVTAEIFYVRIPLYQSYALEVE